MPIHLAAVAHWLLAQAGGMLFSVMSTKLKENMGLIPRQLGAAEMDTLLDRYFHQFEDRITSKLIERMDEDRLVKLNSAINSLKIASKMTGISELKKGYLINAVGKFSDMTSLPPQGRTGGFANGELICLAFLGIAAIHLEMNEPHADIAQKIVTAVYADPETAKQWFGVDMISRLLAVCPQCGTENPPGTKRCRRDNYPLPRVSVPQLQHHALPLPGLPCFCSKGHPNPSGSTTCANCGELITDAYCSLRHRNMLGASECSQCGEPLAGIHLI